MSYIYLLIVFLLFCVSDNNYFYDISNSDFLSNVVENSTIYNNQNRLCLLDYTNFLGNSYYKCSNYIEPVIQKINITSNQIINIGSDNSFFSFTNIFIILATISIIRFVINFKAASLLDSDVSVKRYKETPNSEEQTINNFIGCNNIKKDINELITQIKYHNIFSSNDCNLPKGVLLLGPPGCGKTHLVKTIINATKINYIFASGSDFNKVYVGSGTLMLNQIFTKARENKPCLIFISSIYRIWF